MGSELYANTSDEVPELEYDSNWMRTAAGKQFLATENGEKWLKTSAGKLWLSQMKEIEKKEDNKGSKDKESAYKKFLKEEVQRLLAACPALDTKKANASAKQSWRVNTGCSDCVQNRCVNVWRMILSCMYLFVYSYRHFHMCSYPFK
jgi:hypothetical protein